MGLRSIEMETVYGPKTVSVAEFMALSLDDRVKHILARSVRFFSETGELPLKEGMRLLREMNLGSTGSAVNVATASPASTADRLTLQAFIALPLEQRVKVVLENRVRLYDEHGVEIPLKDALQRVRAARSVR